MKWRPAYNLILAIGMMFMSGLDFSQHDLLHGWVSLILGLGNGVIFFALLLQRT